MTEAQKTAAVIVRLLALYIVVRGGLGLIGLAAFERVVTERGFADIGVTGMAVGSALTLLAAGAILFLGAPVVARVVTFDMR